MGINNAPSHAVFLFLLFKTLCVLAVEKSICSGSHFGLPDYNASNSLLFGSTTGGAKEIDRVDHAFLVQDFAKASNFTEEQWKHNV